MKKYTHIGLYAVPVYIFTVILRLLLAWQTYDSPLHTLNGQFISILTYDAALYGYYASLFLDGIAHTEDVHLIEYIIYYLVTLTPLALDQVMYFTPAFLSALIIIPIMLISSLYIDSKSINILAGLISGIGYGFYSRSYLGYFDTDVLNIFFPMVILWGMLSFIKKNNLFYIFTILVFTFMYIFWYQSSQPLTYALYIFFLFYLLAINRYRYTTLSTQYKYLFIFLLLVILSGVLYFNNLGIYMHHIKRYLIQNSTFSISSFQFVSPMQHITEAKNIDAHSAVHLIAGNYLIFLLSLCGYILLVYRHRETIISLPFVLLGLISFYGGIRFHVYTIFILIISYFFLLSEILGYKKIKNHLTYGIIFLVALSPLYENYTILKEWNHRAKPVFTPEQVNALTELKKIKKSNGYAITWWDYGYAVKYYSGLKTMIDNGKHRSDNYTVAHILLSNSQEYAHHAIHYFYNIFDRYHKDSIVFALKNNKTLKNLQKSIKNKKYTDPKNDRYIILPTQIVDLSYTIYMFGNINPTTGKSISNHIFKTFYIRDEDNTYIYLSDKAKINKREFLLYTNNRKIKLKKITEVTHDKKNSTKEKRLRENGLHLIVEDGKCYIMDDYFYDSLLIQLTLLNQYDSKYFTALYKGKDISIYRVKP